MTAVNVKLSGVGSAGSKWIKPCRQAVTHLTALFKRSRINVVLATGDSKRPTITVKIDPKIKGNAVHGRSSATFSGSGALLSAEVRLPVKVTINTPKGVRGAGPGILEVIIAHEFVHALGHSGHNSHLMGQTMSMVMGNSAAGDKLKAGKVKMPPLKLSSKSVKQLKAIWS